MSVRVMVAPGSRIYDMEEQSVESAILLAYERVGIEGVRTMNGSFAFALRDYDKGCTYLVRDRHGTKPLYYRQQGDVLLIGWSIQSTLSWGRREVDLLGLAEYLTFQNTISGRTLYEGIRLLPAGSIGTWDFKTLKVESYWDYKFTGTAKGTDTGVASVIRERLGKAVERMTFPPEQLGCFLSGGMDTGAVTTLARRRMGRIFSFTCGFDMSTATGLEMGFDERGYAEKLANALKTEQCEVVLQAGDMEAILPDLIRTLEMPRMGQSYPDYYAMRLASRFVDVALSGAGGDELFGGYPWRYYRGIGSKDRADFEHRYYNYWQRLVPDDEKNMLFQPQAWETVKEYSTFEVFKAVLAGCDINPESPEDYVNLSLYFEAKTFLHGLLVIGDAMANRFGLEVRYPFLDNDVVDYALAVPASMKVSLDAPEVVDEDDVGKRTMARGGKRILREAMRGVLPDEVLERPKQGFSAPDASWFRGESMEYVRRMFISYPDGQDARIYEYLRPDYIEGRLEDHFKGRQNNRLFIWSLLCLELWLREFMS